jgi:hypothetical protein
VVRAKVNVEMVSAEMAIVVRWNGAMATGAMVRATIATGVPIVMIAIDRMPTDAKVIVPSAVPAGLGRIVPGVVPAILAAIAPIAGRRDVADPMGRRDVPLRRTATMTVRRSKLVTTWKGSDNRRKYVGWVEPPR